MNDVRTCAITVGLLMREHEVAVDVEGVDLCRTGVVCLIQVATSHGNTYLFDISTIGQNAFDQGCLRELFQSERILKVIFDGRADNDALFHLHRVVIRPAYDLQILHALCNSTSEDRFVKGLQRCLDDSGVVRDSERLRLHQLKEDGKRLFAPDCGGSCAVWAQRPLQTLLINYAAADVRFLMPMKRAWGSASLDNRVLSLTSARIDKAIHAARPAKGKHMAERDFTLGSVPTVLSRSAVAPPLCFTCGQTGHLARNCTRNVSDDDYDDGPHGFADFADDGPHGFADLAPDGYIDSSGNEW